MIKKLITRSISLRLYSWFEKIGDSWPVLVICFFLFILTPPIYAGEIHGNAQIGYVVESDGYEAEINIQYLPWQWLELYAGINVLMEDSGEGTFCPYRDIYIAGIQVNIIEYVYVDIYHHCAHAVYSYRKQFYSKFDGGNKTMVSVGLQW